MHPEVCVEQYADPLFKYAVVRVGNEETAKDLVQDTFLSALKNIDTFRGEISEKNWLFTIRIPIYMQREIVRLQGETCL